MTRPECRDVMATASPFGAEVPAPLDDNDWERLAAFMGRDPRPSLGRERHEEARDETQSRQAD